MIVEKAAKSLDELGKIPFTEDDLQSYIKKQLKKDMDKEKIARLIDILLVSSETESPVRKCIYKEHNKGYSYLYACSFGVS